MNITAIKNEFISIAEMQLSHYEELVSLALDQREILVNGQHDDLPENLRKHDQVLAGIAQMDNHLQAISFRMDETESSASDNFNIRRREIAARASDIISRLQPLVQVNAELLMNAKNFINFSARMLSLLTTEQTTYVPNNDGASQALVLDLKV